MHDQAENLRNRLKGGHEERECHTIAIVSGKGGVGKSNFALNFALALIREKRKVLVMDMDIGMGNIDVLLGRNSTYSINNLFDEDKTIIDLVEKGPNGLDYISGGSGLGNFVEWDERKREKFFSQYSLLSRQYEYVLFDMGAGASRESISFILASDECILISTPEPTALTDAYGMVKYIINNYGKMPINIVMNRAVSDKIGYKALQGLREVAKQFLHANLVELGILPDDPAVQKAVMKQVPYLIYKENAAVSLAVGRLAAIYLGKTLQEANPGTFLTRLKQLVKQRGGGYGNQNSRYR